MIKISHLSKLTFLELKFDEKYKVKDAVIKWGPFVGDIEHLELICSVLRRNSAFIPTR